MQPRPAAAEVMSLARLEIFGLAITAKAQISKTAPKNLLKAMSRNQCAVRGSRKSWAHLTPSAFVKLLVFSEALELVHGALHVLAGGVGGGANPLDAKVEIVRV
jgi:hypothetical protein